jgi:class 3 adenylate cyclase
MAEDISQWLNALDLGQYTQAFIDNGVDLDTLPHLREDDFEKLGGRTVPAEPAEPPREHRSADPERRQLSVMFCDLVGSTELSRQLDPEDLRDVMRRYQDAVAEAVARYGGYVAKYLGDGVLAYFGWPEAYEDQAERAARAGLDAASAVREVQIEAGNHLAARVGIATGRVIVGDLVGETGLDAQAVTGDTPNRAARLQSLARPEQVVIDETTHRLIGRTFAQDDLGKHVLKGFDEAVHAWAVGSEGATESRFDAVHGGQLTEIIGRETELQLLLDRWHLVEAGEGQVALISGEAGIGKSRLVQGLHDLVANSDHIRIRYQCSPFHANSALHPTIQQLERAAGFAPSDSTDARLDKLEAVLLQAGEDLVSDAPLFASLLSLPYEDRYGAFVESAQQLKERLLEALIAQLLSLAKSRAWNCWNA